MKLESLRPILYVRDMDETIRFYREILGFECVSRVGGWASLRKDDARVMISLPNEHVAFEKPVFTGTFYFNTDDVDAFWEQLKDKATIVYPIENFFFGMREFAILDNNGYILQFGSEITDPSQIPPPDQD